MCDRGRVQTRQNESDDAAALACLAQLAASSADLHEQISRLSERIRVQDAGRGMTYADTLPLERRMEMVEHISEAMRALTTHGHRFRRAQARALYAEGLTMAQLAAVFGVSRQRVSALLRDGAGEGDVNGDSQDVSRRVGVPAASPPVVGGARGTGWTGAAEFTRAASGT